MHGDDSTADDALAAVLAGNCEVVIDALAGAPGAAGAMTALAAARAAADATEQATRRLVSRAREAGHTWQEIGELLAITRQAAQQRFGEPSRDGRTPATGALARRAAELVAQIDAGDWAGATGDWAPAMFAQDGPDRVARAWRALADGAGELQTIGPGTVMRRGPFSVVDVPLVFSGGPLTARVSFGQDERVTGLFLLVPGPR